MAKNDTEKTSTDKSNAATQGAAEGQGASAVQVGAPVSGETSDQASQAAGLSGADQTGQSGSGQSGTTAAGKSESASSSGKAEGGAIALLKADHERVDQLFKQYEKARDGRTKAGLVRQICEELVIHTLLEEEIFYPACRAKADDEDTLDEAQVEHDSAKLLISDLMSGDEADEFRDAKVSVLAEQIRHHVREEEGPGGVFALARSKGLDTTDLARRLKDLKTELEAEELPPPRPVSLSPSVFQGLNKEESMARSQNMPERDENGRFMSDDDRGGGRGGGRSSSGGGGGGRGGGRYDDDDRGYRSRGRDDDDGRGWYGDSRGHAEAARRGWDERRGGESRSFRDDDDDRGYRSRGRDDDGDRGQGGWFGDSRGHAEAARRGWEERGGGRGSRSYRDDDDDRGYRSRGRDDDGDRGQGGWFGDSRGHAEAARKGWEERSGGGGGSRSSRDDDDRGGYRGQDRERDDRGRFMSDDDDDRGYRSRGRSRDDDDDRGGRGHGGWFGDSRGHAEAARKGWQDRR